MNLNFQAAITALGGVEGVFRLINEARPPARLLLNTLLPERLMSSYHVDGGSMTVRATMPGLVGMDSPYPPGGLVEISTFLEQSAKIANHVTLGEATLRHLQDFIMRLGMNGGNTNEALANQTLNFFNKVVMQPHFDVFEWLRGQALTYGKIDWTFNKKRWLVDYGFPAANFLTPRTGNDGYGGSASKFWADVALLRRRLKNDVRVILAHVDTVEMARYNTVNQMVAEGGNNGGAVTFRRWVNNGANFTLDVANDAVTIVGYGDEGEIINPANPETTIVVPFIERGKLVAIGNNVNNGFVVGAGSSPDADELAQGALGYTHIAPTVEGDGRPGRWGDMFTPEFEPWSIHSRAVTNGVPVIEAYTKVAVATTDMV
jgi:hypothetical protein